MQNKYHLTKGTVRTTTSLDKTLSGLLAVKLGQIPETPAAHAAVRQWLQGRLDDNADPSRVHTSQWLAGEVALFVSDKILSEVYLNWLTGI